MIALLLLVSSMAGQASLQPRPDYSGVWELTDRRGLTDDVDLALEIRQWTAPVFLNLTVVRRTASGVRSENHMIGVMSGVVSGIPSGAPGPPVTDVRSSALWDSRDLVIWNTKYSLERTERWSLHKRGRLVVTITLRAAGSEPTTATRTYRRLRDAGNMPDAGTRYFKEDHLTGADYLALLPDARYQLVNREHMGIWFVEAGAWRRSGARIELTPARRDKTPYSGREILHRGRTFLAWESDEAPGLVVNADETKRQLDQNPRVLPSYVFFEISKSVHDRETRETYPFRTRRLNHP